MLCFLCNDLYAQQAYKIEYLLKGRFTVNKQPQQMETKFGLVYNDTLSFFYIKPKYGDKFKNARVLGDKLDNHALMYNKNTDELWHEVDLGRKKHYVIVDTPNYFKWAYTYETKKILGYNCNVAFTVSPANDTIVLWYTSQLGSYFGPMRYFGVPGIVLEAFDPEFNNHLVATKVEESSAILVLPNVEKIPMKKYLEEQKRNK